jgi:hypothetical protein
METARVILQQLGGSARIAAATGAKRFEDIGDGVAFDIGRRTENRANRVAFTYNGNELYSVEFTRVYKHRNAKWVGSVGNVPLSTLPAVFETKTGLRLSPFRTEV